MDSCFKLVLTAIDRTCMHFFVGSLKLLFTSTISNVQYGYLVTLYHQNPDYVLIIHNALLSIYSYWDV